MTFLDRYLKCVSTLECPESYHIFSALGMVSALCGRRVWSRRGFIVTFPNLYVALVGEPGSGKTVAMRIARDILSGIDEIKIAPKCASARKFMSIMESRREEFEVGGIKHVHSPIAVFLSELSNFIKLDPDQIIPFLTDGYDDAVFDYETEHKGEVHIHGPAISLVACCTHQWITEKMKEDVITDGLSGRFLWILEDKSDSLNSFPDLTPEMQEGLDSIRRECVQIMGLSGEFEWSKEAREAWDEWYYPYYKKADSRDGYSNRKKVQLEKIAMLLAMANRKELVLRAEDFKEGLKILKIMERNLPKVFEGVGRNELQSVVTYLMSTLERNGNGGMDSGRLKLMLYHMASTKEIDEVMLHLHQTKQIFSEDGRIKLVPGRKGLSHEVASLEDHQKSA